MMTVMSLRSSLRCFETCLRFTFLGVFFSAVVPAVGVSFAESGRERMDGLVKEYRQLAESDKGSESVAVLRTMLSQDPNHPLPYRLLAFETKKKEDYSAALELVEGLGPDGPGRTFGRGLLTYFSRDFPGGVKLIRESAEGYREIGHELGRGYALVALGTALRRQGSSKWDGAGQAFLDARPLFEQVDHPLGVAYVLEGLGSLEYSRRKYEAALELMGQALAIREAEGGFVEQAESLLWIGRIHRVSGDPAAALPPLESAMELRREHAPLTAHPTLLEIGRAQWALGERDAGLATIAEALDLAVSLGSPLRITFLRIELGGLLDRAGRTREAIEMLRLAVESAEEYGYWEHEARAYSKLGTALIYAGELVSARQALERAVERASGHERGRQTVATALNDLGKIDAAHGDFAQALLRHRRALEMQREVGDARYELSTLNLLGITYYWMGRHDLAERYLVDLLGRSREGGNKSKEQLALTNLGNLLIENDGRRDEAVTHLQAALEIAVERGNEYDLAYARLNNAFGLWRTGKHEESEKLLGEALTGFRDQEDHHGEAMALSVSAELSLEKNETDDALATYAEAAGIAGKRGFQGLVREAHEGRARVFERLGRKSEALDEYLAALDIIESQRARLSTGDLKMAFVADKAAIYERALALQLAIESGKGGAPDSLLLAERARARSLLDQLAESRSALRDSLPAKLVARETAAVDELGFLAQKLAWETDEEEARRLQSEMGKAEEALRTVELEIQRAAPRYSELAYPAPIGLGELQSGVLRDGETVLRYFIGEKESGLWIVDPNDARFHRLASPDEIAGLVGDYLEAAGRASVVLGNRIPGAAESAELADALLLSRVPKGRRLLIVPDGPLHHLPFDSLSRGGRFLIEDHEIVVVPSASALKLMREQPVRVAAGGFLGVGAPEHAGAAEGILPALPYAGVALDRIAAMFPEEERVVLKGKALTKAALAEQPTDRFRYVHFATHGRLDPRNPRYLGLQLGAGSRGKEPEFLYPEDVFRMRLAADMVVLSACSSGLGELLEGEGIVGMTRGFLYAGARSVLVTLWDVNDKSTGEFMEAFYKKISDGTPAAEALRSVKLEFLADEDQPARRQPYRWAPFVLMGDPPASRGRSNRKAEIGHSDYRGGRTDAVR